MNHDDPLGEALRRVLRAEADEVQPGGDGLVRIRERTSRRSLFARFRPALLATATVAVLGVAGGAAYSTLLGDEQRLVPPATAPTSEPTSERATPAPSATNPPPLDSPTPRATSARPRPTEDAGKSVDPTVTPTLHEAATPPPPGDPAPDETPPPSPTATATPPPSTTSTVGVYYAGDTERGPKLYREFHAVPVTGGAVITAAVEDMLRGTPNDPDYRGLWAAGTRVLGINMDGDAVTVDLSQAAPADAELALQQLVHTVTAVDTDVRTVQLRVNGVPVGEPVARAPQTDVLAPVWLTAPVEGATLPAGGVQLEGLATVFEGTVNWQVLRDGAVVKEGFTTASEGAPGRGTWSDTVTLEPGSYVVRALTYSAEDGSPQFADTKQITVD
jgi:hypothetical protein